VARTVRLTTEPKAVHLSSRQTDHHRLLKYAGIAILPHHHMQTGKRKNKHFNGDVKNCNSPTQAKCYCFAHTKVPKSFALLTPDRGIVNICSHSMAKAITRVAVILYRCIPK